MFHNSESFTEYKYRPKNDCVLNISDTSLLSLLLESSGPWIPIDKWIEREREWL